MFPDLIERRTRIVHRQPVPASRSIKRRSLINEKTSIQPCSRLVPDSSEKTRTALTKGTGAALPHLVDWCAGLLIVSECRPEVPKTDDAAGEL